MTARQAHHVRNALCWCALSLWVVTAPVAAQDGSYTATAIARSSDSSAPSTAPSNASSTVTRATIDERLVSSPPDALRYEPGITVQQTAHGQASVFVRGLTGQQVVHVFDGVRLNNSLYRRGPNQYLFNLDTQTIAAITVLRGSSSVLHGSDALGGAILLSPVTPEIAADQTGVALHPEVHLRLATADISGGGRVALSGQLGARTALLLGGGYFDASRLQSGGQIDYGARDVSGDVPSVPRFDRDGRTQLGTGYREATFDARLVHQLSDALRVTGALYGYRQYDAPRTDQCPRPGAPVGDCLTIEQQFRTLAYATVEGDAATDVQALRVTVSLQHSRERRRDHRISRATDDRQRDAVTTWGLAASAATRSVALGRSQHLQVRYGGDAYLDLIDSRASSVDAATGQVTARSRGVYLSDSRYLTSGLYADASLNFARRVELRAGVRGAFSHAHVPGDPESGSAPIDRGFAALVARAGVTWQVSTPLSIVLNVDQGFRAPNLDDLSARQSIGAGFQIDNARLTPERTVSSEIGARFTHESIDVDGWLYWTAIQDAVLREARSPADCPIDAPQCSTAASQLTLVNATDHANILGAESRVTWKFLKSTSLRTTFAYAFGEGPNTAAPSPETPTPPARVPLSRVPPMNGTVELQHHDAASGVYGVIAARWANAQTRLAPTDATDPRIPPTGTPAYAVFELRAGYRFDDRLRISAAIDNLLDTAYRIHGSSLNGPGRNLKVSISTLW